MSFEAYGPALAVLALWGLTMIGLSMNSTRGLTDDNRAPSGKPKRNYADPAYRRDRAFQNAIETSPAFLATLLAAILSGAAPLVVNILAGVFLLSRWGMAYVHIAIENGPARSAFFGVGWLMIILLALSTIWAVIAG